MSFFDKFGGYSGMIMNYATTTAFWIFVMVLISMSIIVFLIFRKKRKLNKFVLEHIDLGNGNFDFRLTKGGFFKNKFTFFGLLDYGGEDRFRLKDGTPVDNVSHHDYRRFNNKLCIGILRNPHDPKMVFPISKYYVSKASRAIMAEVAPADYRDSAEKAIESADREMQTKWAQYAPMIVTGLVIVIALIITLLNTQYGKYMVDKTTQLIMELKTTPCSAIPSGVAP